MKRPTRKLYQDKSALWEKEHIPTVQKDVYYESDAHKEILDLL